MGQVTRFFTFSQFHAKTPVAGSTYIRVNQLIKYWPEADVYKYGERVDNLILQKVYVADDWQWPVNIKAKKILDLCDPDWLNGLVNIKQTINAVDAVTCSSEGLVNLVKQYTDKPVHYVPDRFDIDVIPKPKVHKGKAKTVVWFGYSQNAELLRPAIPLLERHNLKLRIISNDDPIAYRWGNPEFKDDYKFIKYEEDTIYKELQKADICLLPQGTRPIDPYKSNNKTIKAILAGLPVANDHQTLERFINAEERTKELEHKYDIIKAEYDARKSVKQLQDIFDDIKG